MLGSKTSDQGPQSKASGKTAIHSLPKGTPEKEEVWGQREEKFGFVSMKAKVLVGTEEAMQRCVALLSSNLTLNSLEGIADKCPDEEKKAQRWGPEQDLA